jgi:signal transduction histidine kinase
MLAQPDSEANSPSPTTRASRGGLVSIPPTIQQIAVSEALRCASELGNPVPPEITDLLVIVAASVLETQITPDAVIDARAQSPLGRRLLQIMKEEILRGWKSHGIAEPELPPLLLAIEHVREALENDPVRAFASQLGSEGLKLLVEVAHDMHSPLGSILFLAETLQRGESGPVTDLQRRQLGLICTAALGLSSVGKDIIDLERSDLLLEPKPVPFSLTAVLEAVRDIVRPIAEVKQLAVRVAVPEPDERLGQPVALRRVLLNLTTNALKFTERGFVEIVAREVKPGRVEFAVRDSGRGIDPAVMPTLFEPIRHAPQGEHEVRGRKLFSNTGLGLTICRKLAEAMGSQLRVETQLGRGTRFFFELELPISPSRRSSDPDRKRSTVAA